MFLMSEEPLYSHFSRLSAGERYGTNLKGFTD